MLRPCTAPSIMICMVVVLNFRYPQRSPRYKNKKKTKFKKTQRKKNQTDKTRLLRDRVKRWSGSERLLMEYEQQLSCPLLPDGLFTADDWTLRNQFQRIWKHVATKWNYVLKPSNRRRRGKQQKGTTWQWRDDQRLERAPVFTPPHIDHISVLAQ